MQAFPEVQDVFGQLTFLRAYTVISLGFPVQEDNKQAEIAQQLENATLKLTETFPWLAGQVITEGSCEGNTGLQKVVPYGPNTVQPVIIIKDCVHLCPPYSELIDAKAPSSMLDGDIISPRSGLPVPYEGPTPVLIIQANFIKSGLILTFASQHNIFDMNGQAQVIRLFAKALRGETFTHTEITEGNRDRRNIIPLLAPDEPLEDHSILRPLPQQGQNQSPPSLLSQPSATPRWAYFRFSASKLTELKALALALPPTPEHGNHIPLPVSTNDALTGFTWQRITAARLAAHPAVASPNSPPPVLCRAMNSRNRLGISPAYMGHAVFCTFTNSPSSTLSDLPTTPLSVVAHALRASLINEATPRHVRSLVTLIARTPDKSTIAYGARLDLAGFDVMFSSWAGLELAETDFGTLGRPGFMRRPRFVGFPGLCYAMPKTVDGDIDLAICLEEEEIKALEADEKWREMAQPIG